MVFCTGGRTKSGAERRLPYLPETAFACIGDFIAESLAAACEYAVSYTHLSAAVQTGQTFSTENRATPAKEHRAMTSSKNSIAMWKTNLPSSALPNAMSFRLAAHPPPPASPSRAR